MASIICKHTILIFCQSVCAISKTILATSSLDRQRIFPSSDTYNIQQAWTDFMPTSAFTATNVSFTRTRDPAKQRIFPSSDTYNIQQAWTDFMPTSVFTATNVSFTRTRDPEKQRMHSTEAI